MNISVDDLVAEAGKMALELRFAEQEIARLKARLAAQQDGQDPAPGEL